MSRIAKILKDGDETLPSPLHPVRRKLGKVSPMVIGMVGSRSVNCSLCHRKIFSGLLLAHKQEAHGDTVYSRTATGRPKNIWFRPPATAKNPGWRRPAALRPVFGR